MKPILLGILLWTCLISIAITQKQIDTFNILFPQSHTENSSHPIELVTVSGGCFQWASSSPQTVSVQGLQIDDQNCHNQGLVTLKHIGAYQGSIYVTATNVQTNQLSIIPVRISPVQRIEIMAKSRLMNRNQMQDLEIFAYDKEHNIFTSLEGLKFEWTLVEAANVLSKVSLKNSHLSLPLDERKEIEKRGAESDILVIKGENPGKAVVRVKCIEPGYQHLRHQITVSVQQRFHITPSVPTYMIVSSTYNFGLISPSREVLSLAKPYYSATMSSKLFKVTDSLQVTAPLIEDESILRVEDTRTVPAYSSQVVIYSKQPTSILLKVDEYLIVGEESKVDVELYWNKQLLKGETRDFKVVTDLVYDIVKSTITGRQRTTATVKASYKSLSTQKKVHIVLPIKAIIPSSRVTLPIDQTFQLKIVGGSGIYEYQIQNDIASISGSGVISCRKQGKARVTISDKRVARNRVVVQLVVAPVDSLIPLQSRKEVNVNQFGLVFTMARGKNYQQYTKCTGQPIALEISHLPTFEQSNNVSFSSALQFLSTKMSQSITVKQTIMKNAILPLGVEDFITKFATYIKAGDISTQQLRQYSLELQNYGICSVHNIRSSQKYDSTLSIYHRQNVNIKNKFNLRVYDKIINAIGRENGDYFIMTPFSALQWKTNGGSYPWEAKTRTLVNGVEYHTEYPIVKCPEKQTVLQMKLQRVNPQSIQLLLPANQSKTIYIHCKHPSQLKLKFEKQSLDIATINGLKGQLIKGQLIPLDNKGQSFYNASNLVYGVSKTAGGVKVNGDKFEFDALGANSAQVTFWTDRIQGVKQTFSKVSTSFIYNSRQMFTLSPHPQNNHLTTLYNPKRPYTFTLQKISENSQVQCQGSINCYYKNKQIHVNTTRLGSGSMRIVDKSLYQYPTLLIKFDVVDADRIVLEVEKHNVEVQKKILAEVKMFYKQELIPAWQYDTRSLLLVHEAGLRSKQVESSSASTKNIYQITAEKPGSYRVTVEQHYPKYLESSPVLLTVYPKFETNIPSLEHSYTKDDVLELKGELTVAVDCIRTVHLIGGPQLISILHSIKDKGLLEIKQTTKESKEISILGIKEGKTAVTFTITSAHGDSSAIISIIHLIINIKPIDHVTIYSLDEALLNAQFRIIPYLIVEGRVLLDSVCEFQYKWTSDSARVKLSGVDGKNKRGLGVNATAVKEGDAYVTVQVLKRNKVLFATTKQITIHKSIDIQLPTVIGQHQSLTSTSSNLLIPPNSGYQLQDTTISIHKLSQSSLNLLTINPNNRLLTGRQRGVISMKLQKSTDQSYNNYLNIIVTDIKGLFIENSYSVVNVDVGKVTDVKFYVQDMYGRLFYNNLFNVEYEIVSSNQDVFTVSLDNNKNCIRVHPKKQGEATLMVKLKSSESHLNNLVEIPHDVVTVQVGKVIQPQSPIYLVVGGEVNIQYYGKGTQKWEVLTGNKLISIDQKNRIITALQTGQSTISINGYIVTVRILDLVLKQRTTTEPTPGSAQLTTEYVATGKWMDELIYFQSISNTFNYINNNLNLTCLPVNRRYFATNSSIIKTGDFDKLKCETVMNYDFEIYESMPSDIELKVVTYDQKGAKSYLHTTKKPILPTFWIPKVHKNVILSPETPEVDIFVKSPHKLHTEVIGGKAEWIVERFDEGSTTHGVKIKINPTQYHHNLQFKLKLTHPQTAQTQQITVKYIIDEATRKAHQAQTKSSAHQQRSSQKVSKSQQPTVSSSNGWFVGWHWTDFIILIMGVNFILILVYQAFFNGGDKYKTL